MKAIQVTEDNYKKLGMQYDIPELEMKGSINFWMVVPFGQDARPEGFLLKSQLLVKFDLGGKIKNGWYDLTVKAAL